MKTWEMVRELMENPYKEFISGRGIGLMKAYTEGNVLIFKYNDPGMDDVIGIDFTRRWQEVKEPVSFIEAVESGKNVRVRHDIINDLVLEENDFFREYYNKYVPISILLHNIANYFISDEEIRDIILNGEWYIE